MEPLDAAAICRWYEAELARAGRMAEPSNRGFPSAADVVDLAQAPEAAREAQRYYHQACFDWGNAWVLRHSVGGAAVFAVYAGTDGDTGWLELFDADGGLIAAASLDGDRVVWEPQAIARARVATGEPPP